MAKAKKHISAKAITAASRVSRRPAATVKANTGDSGSDSGGTLVLGWQVTATLVPKYWLNPVAKAGMQTDVELVRVPAEDLACHSAVVAQSGSGKSFFLGRLIEELLLATKARCVILDPNADFRRISEVVDAARWTNAGYEHSSARGFLPTESTKEAFENRWSQVDKRVLAGPQFASDSSEQMQLSWASLSVDFFSEDVPTMLRTDLYHCHEYVKAVAVLLEFKRRHGEGFGSQGNRPSRQDESADFIKVARKILPRAKVGSLLDRKETIRKEFNTEALLAQIRGMGSISRWYSEEVRIQRQVDRAAAAVEYISEIVERYYFGRAQEYIAQGIVESKVRSHRTAEKRTRLEVIDLPSFPDLRTRFLALNSVLATEWRYARSQWSIAMAQPDGDDRRVPTFIVVDEAHNLIPVEPRGLAADALREQFRIIAAEGRKYGLFLIVCTQRPDKIDPLILSECENRAIMRVGSHSVLDKTQQLFGLDDVPATVLRKCLEFEIGRALLIGKWAKAGPEFLYTAMRRTVEGGRNLSGRYWATHDGGVAGRTQRSSKYSKNRSLKAHA